MANNVKIRFLHNSTGGEIWTGGVVSAISNHNSNNGKSYTASEQWFLGGNNQAQPYYNAWVGNPNNSVATTLETFTQNYDVIVWKHCYPFSNILADTGSPDINSPRKSLENYKLQYQALKTKMRSFPNNRFIVWTSPALVAGATNSAEATRALEFANWMKNTWDEPNDNIFIWDFRELETGPGGLYLLPANAVSTSDSHPNTTFSATVAPLLSQRIIDVIEGRGDSVLDTTAPVVTTFTIPATSTSLTISGINIVATDAIGVTAYLLSESSTKPLSGASGWTMVNPTTYTFQVPAGSKTLYAWAKDGAGNVSDVKSATTTITIPPAGNTLYIDPTYTGAN